MVTILLLYIPRVKYRSRGYSDVYSDDYSDAGTVTIFYQQHQTSRNKRGAIYSSIC